jgi:hypothetical protein
MNQQINPARSFDLIEKALRFGVHSEWNVRNLEIIEIGFGLKWVRCVFRDDGPVWNSRQRHADITAAFMLSESVDLNAWKVEVWRWLESVKN